MISLQSGARQPIIMADVAILQEYYYTRHHFINSTIQLKRSAAGVSKVHMA